MADITSERRALLANSAKLQFMIHDERYLEMTVHVPHNNTQTSLRATKAEI